MTAAVKPNLNNEITGRSWTVLTDLSSADIDLVAHAQGSGHPARAIDVISGGILVVVKPNNTTETTPTLPSGFQLVGQVQVIKKASSGTTATAVIVYW